MDEITLRRRMAKATEIAKDIDPAAGGFFRGNLERAVLAGMDAADAEIDRYTLPCDVMLTPNTVIRKGCRLNTLIAGLIAREQIAE